MPGDYSIPFVFKTPLGFPGTFSYVAGTTSASIRFKITAILNSPTEKLKGSSLVHMIQDLKAIKSNVSIMKTARLKT